MCKGFDTLGRIYVHIFRNTKIYRSNFTWRIMDYKKTSAAGGFEFQTEFNVEGLSNYCA